MRIVDKSICSLKASCLVLLPITFWLSLPVRSFQFSSQSDRQIARSQLGIEGIETCWLRMSMGPKYLMYNNWQRQVICTGLPFELHGKRAILTAAHCFFWKNKIADSKWDWDNQQIIKVERDELGEPWLNFDGDIELYCGKYPKTIDESKTIRLHSRPENQIVRIHPIYDGYQPPGTNGTLGTSNMAIIYINQDCQTTLQAANNESSLASWIFKPLVKPASLPAANTHCHIIGFNAAMQERTRTVRVTADTVCNQKWPSVHPKPICVEMIAHNGTVLLLDNGGPLLCASETAQNGPATAWQVQGVGFLGKRESRGKFLIASIHSNWDFLDSTMRRDFESEGCVQ